MAEEQQQPIPRSIENAPLEVLYAAIRAGRKYINDPTDENHAIAERAEELARIVEFLPSRKGEQPNILLDLAAAAIGLIGFAEDGTPIFDKSLIIHIVREVVLKNPEAQQLINDDLQERFGQTFDFQQLGASRSH